MGLTSDYTDKRLVTYVPRWLYDAVRYEAKREGLTLSECVRAHLMEYYRPLPGKTDEEVSLDRLVKAGQLGFGLSGGKWENRSSKGGIEGED